MNIHRHVVDRCLGHALHGIFVLTGENPQPETMTRSEVASHVASNLRILASKIESGYVPSRSDHNLFLSARVAGREVSHE